MLTIVLGIISIVFVVAGFLFMCDPEGRGRTMTLACGAGAIVSGVLAFFV